MAKSKSTLIWNNVPEKCEKNSQGGNVNGRKAHFDKLSTRFIAKLYDVFFLHSWTHSKAGQHKEEFYGKVTKKRRFSTWSWGNLNSEQGPRWIRN